MTKKNFFAIIVIIIITNLVTIYFYDRYHTREDAIRILSRAPIKATVNWTEDLESIGFGRRTAITEAVKMIEPAVVSVNVVKTELVRLNPFAEFHFFHLFNIPLQRDVSSIATGVLFRSDGFIITNSHVVENANKITVVMSNNEEFEAILVGLDRIHDIAIIKIEGKNFPYARLGTSSDLMIGEWSIAVGNPFGFLMRDRRPSVSVGVISALDRNFTVQEDAKVYKGMIQTDAAINPGNSGGPLVNIYGEVIGINSFIFTQSGGSVGIGFAIPIDRVKRIAEELINYGEIREIYLGFRIQELTREIASALRLRSLDGVIVSVIDNDSPAYHAGLKRGDIITRIDDVFVRNASDIQIAVSDLTPGSQISFRVLREGSEIDVTLIAGEYH